MVSQNASGAIVGIMYFYFVTIVYFIAKNIIKNDKLKMTVTFLYFISVIVGEFLINLNVTTETCGTAQFEDAIIVTIIPWVIIFGLLKVVLSAFPGWLTPFSNTFGYLFASLLGVNKVLDDILIPKYVKETTPDTLKAAAESLEHIYGNKSLLINEITLESFDSFWTKLSSAGLFKKNANDHKESLLNFIKIKNEVAEFVWYFLTGGLVTVVSYNTIINSTCKSSKEKLEATVKADINATNKAQTTAKVENKNNVIYKVTE